MTLSRSTKEILLNSRLKKSPGASYFFKDEKKMNRFHYLYKLDKIIIWQLIFSLSFLNFCSLRMKIAEKIGEENRRGFFPKIRNREEN